MFGRVFNLKRAAAGGKVWKTRSQTISSLSRLNTQPLVLATRDKFREIQQKAFTQTIGQTIPMQLSSIQPAVASSSSD